MKFNKYSWKRWLNSTTYQTLGNIIFVRICAIKTNGVSPSNGLITNPTNVKFGMVPIKMTLSLLMEISKTLATRKWRERRTTNVIAKSGTKAVNRIIGVVGPLSQMSRDKRSCQRWVRFVYQTMSAINSRIWIKHSGWLFSASQPCLLCLN